MFRLLTLGGLSLTNGDAFDQKGTRRLHLALLARLAVAGRQGVSRDHLLALLWPESDEARARDSLKQAIYLIRRSLGAPSAISGTEQLRLDNEVVTSDVGEFDTALRDGDLRRAVELYRGPFLDAVHVGNSEFEAWRDAEAARLAGQHRDALARLARGADDKQNHFEALGWWRALERADPLSASVITSLIRALVANGDYTDAINAGRAYAGRVRAELEVEPEVRVLRLIEEIERKVAAEASVAVPKRSAQANPAAPDAATVSAGIGEPPKLSWRETAVRFVRRKPSAAFALGLAASTLVVAMSSWALPIDANGVRIVRAVPAPLDSGFATELFEVLGSVDPTLSVSRRSWRSARYVVSLEARQQGDSLHLLVDLQDNVRRTRRLIGPCVNLLSKSDVALHDCVERIAVLIEARRNALFASWADSAAMPYNLASYRELLEGIASWTDVWSTESTSHFDAAGRLDSTSATPLVWKALELWSGERGKHADTALARLDSTTRRMGAWDHVVAEIVHAWDVNDLQRSHAAGHELLKMFPRSEWALLPAYDALGLGRERETIELLKSVPRAYGWTPRWADIIEAQSLHMLGDFETLDRIRHRCRTDEDLACMQFRVNALAGLGRVEEVKRICLASMKVSVPDRPFPLQPCAQAEIELWAHGYGDAAYDLARKWIALIDVSPSLTRDQKAVFYASLFCDIGRWNDATRELAKIVTPPDTEYYYLESLALTQAARGDRRALTETHKLLVAAGIDEDVSLRAKIAALLGDRDEALALIVRARREAPWWPTSVHWTAAYGPLHGDPRYQDLVRVRDEPEQIKRQ